MIEKIRINNQPLIESGSSTGRPNSSGGLRGSDVDVSIEVNYASLVEKAMQPPENDEQRVRQARQLYLSGKLESKKIIEGAAKNILKYGI